MAENGASDATDALVTVNRSTCVPHSGCMSATRRDARSAELVHEHFDLRPKGIILMLDLLRPIYEKTAAYGHFGREEPEFTWERTDKVEALKAAAGL